MAADEKETSNSTKWRLLAQVAHWFATGTEPIDDEVYLAAPLSLEVEFDTLRDLFILLATNKIEIKGNLCVRYHKSVLDETLRVTPIQWSKQYIVKRDYNFDILRTNIESVNFVDSCIINWSVELIEQSRKTEKYKRTSGWDQTYTIENVKVDYSALSHAGNPNTPMSAAPKGKQGRPAKFNWDLIWAELVVRAELDGLPPTQADCIREISQWCIDRFGDAPSETTLKEKIRLIYTHHRKAGRKA